MVKLQLEISSLDEEQRGLKNALTSEQDKRQELAQDLAKVQFERIYSLPGTKET